jgi:hypothetical protein
MNILELHFTGGILFMSILSIAFITMIALNVIGFMRKGNAEISMKFAKVAKEVGVFALAWGVLGQVIGLLGAFQAIEAMGEVSQAILAGGLRVSSYTTIYGLIIFIISRIIYTIRLQNA